MHIRYVHATCLLHAALRRGAQVFDFSLAFIGSVIHGRARLNTRLSLV